MVHRLVAKVRIGTYLAVVLALGDDVHGQARHTFEKQVLTERFYSEGASIGDIDGDGDADVVAGPFWYEGPEFTHRHAYMPPQEFRIASYSDHFLSFTHDFNGDGRTDILVIPWPGEQGYWYENPGGLRGLSQEGQGQASDKDESKASSRVDWPRHPTIEHVDGESPALVDITGDGSPEMVCIYQGSFVYARPRAEDPTAPWEMVRLTPDRGYGRYTHGQGVGDVDGDGRMDLIETNGWWQQPEDWQPGESFRLHAARFAEAGGAQMFAYDVDGDGDNDIISSQNAHAYGLSWFEQQVIDGERRFVEHRVMGEDPGEFDHGVAFSQLHALALADIDGDGVKDVVTGKRYWAHGGNDPGAHGLPVLYWFQVVRTGRGVEFVPHLIDNRTGVGTQVTVGDVDGDEDLDVVVGNKLGAFVVRHEVEHETGADLDNGRDALAESRSSDGRDDVPRSNPLFEIGGDAFASHVRPTEHLTASEEQARFVLPPGFEIQLVAAEPQIAKPLNIAFDGRGRLWVTDTLEYPYPAPLDRPGKDSIKILEDTNGDGQADKVTTFADGLNIPMGLYPYRDGVICFSIPNIWFMRDTDGDDRADERTVLYGPLGYERDVHGLCNAFRRGFDGWLYACHGFNNQTNVRGNDGHAISMNSGNTFRMRLDGGRIEHHTWGQVNPFGMAFDALGNIFTADCHTKPVTLLLAGGYYESFGKPHDGLGFVPSMMNHLHGSTAIGGMALYDGKNFPAEYVGSTFGGNVMTSRVNRNSLVYEGGSVRAEEEPDFVISGDPWFRPADLRVGPDGALYIADFYNKIIGHYEVPLDHPGRDRTSGRIWRVVYKGPQPNPEPPLKDTDLTGMSVEKLLDLLDTSNLTQRMLIADRLVDHFGSASVEATRTTLATTRSPTTRVHAMWVLYRLGELTADELYAAVKDADPSVRLHALDALEASREIPGSTVDWLLHGFTDSDARVRRAAAMAATRILDARLVEPLMNLYFETAPSDVHLRHAVRMALRNHLRRDEWLARLAPEHLDAERGELVAGICLALDSPVAADFVIQYVGRQSIDDRNLLAEYIQYAAGHVGAEPRDALARLVQERFAEDKALQLQLIDAVRQGLVRRGEPLGPVISDWAVHLAKELLHLGKLGSPVIAWESVPGEGSARERQAWIAELRPSSDGAADQLFYGSLSHGEQWTGLYRSSPFALPETFSFFVAGHAGYPNEPAHHKNVVRLRDTATGEILQQCFPPRNDTAQRVTWDTSAWSGRSAVVEIVDGDQGDAYAWLAVGRFSVSELNPSPVPQDRRKAAELAGRFGLVELRSDLQAVLQDSWADAVTSKSLLEAFVALAPDTRLAAACEALDVEGCADEFRRRIAEAVVTGDGDSGLLLLADLMVVATARDQLRIANRLAGDRQGIEALLQLAESGRASAQLLRQPSIAPRLQAAGGPDLRRRVSGLIESVAEPNEAAAQLVSDLRQALANAATDVVAGEAVYREHCANCHQLAGDGSKVGPQLDGIGNRGVERILEDLLDPNRNVDVAFQTTTIVTTAGQIMSGIPLREEGMNLVLANQEGQEFAVAKDDIDEKYPSPLSLMPANFGEVLSEQQVLDLAAYLAKQRQ